MKYIKIKNFLLQPNHQLMKVSFFTLFLFFIGLNQTKANCNADDWTALKALYNSTNLASLNLPGWDVVANNTSPPMSCDFNDMHGVEATFNGFPTQELRVTRLALINESIIGTIPSEIEKLNYLGWCELEFNQLSGPIPAEIGNLTNLIELNLSNNQLNGNIPPSFVNLSNLFILDLSHNQLSGTIPLEIWLLTGLSELHLNNNQFSGGVTTSLATFNSPFKLSLNNNNLSGCFNQSFAQFCSNTIVEMDAGNNFDVTWVNFCTNGAGACIEFDMNIKVILEGAYIKEELVHNNSLFNRGLLPGMTPVSNLATLTPQGQPYHVAPWNYQGDEGLFFNDGDYSYLNVDWVLVSLRTALEKSSEIFKAAGILDIYGNISMVNTPFLSNLTDPLYIVVEHRNHMPVMSPQPVSFTSNTLTYNFSLQDSYRDVAQTGFGQKEISPGLWAAFAGNMSQNQASVGNPQEDINDINGADKAIWASKNGNFDYYHPADTNLDGDINGMDKAQFSSNNGFSSRVPQ